MMVFMHSKRWMLAFILPIVTLTVIGWVSTHENWLHFRPENATPPARVFAVPQVFWVEKYITFDHWTWAEVSKSVLASISLYVEESCVAQHHITPGIYPLYTPL